MCSWLVVLEQVICISCNFLLDSDRLLFFSLVTSGPRTSYLFLLQFPVGRRSTSLLQLDENWDCHESSGDRRLLLDH